MFVTSRQARRQRLHSLKISSFANATYASGSIATYDKLVQHHHAAVKGRHNFLAVRACNCFSIIYPRNVSLFVQTSVLSY